MRGHRQQGNRVVFVGTVLVAVTVGFSAVWFWPRRVAPLRLEQAPAEVAAATPPYAAPHPPPGLDEAAAPEAAAPEAQPGMGEIAVYHPRDKGEWQGMLVNMTLRAFCDGPRSCGLAAACIDGRCGPCQADRECADGEVCVLDHCLRAEHAHCRSRRDCAGEGEGEGEEALCVLSGYSPDARGNAGMHAECLVPKGGHELPADVTLQQGALAAAPPVSGNELLESVRAAHAAGH